MAKPNNLSTQTQNIIDWRKYDNFSKTDFGEFMREVSKQAIELQQEG